MGIETTAAILTEVIDQALHAAQGTANAKSLTFATDIAADLILHADKQRLRQVADNLLSNAIKYTPTSGAITVTAHEHGAGHLAP